jgi:hypothetical protein
MTEDTLPVPEIDPHAELPEVTPYGRSWQDAAPTLPPPVLTAVQSLAMDWEWWIGPAESLKRAAEKAGWTVVLLFSRGYKKGRRKDTFELLDLIGAACWKVGQPRAVFTWERSPDQGCTWKATTCSIRAGHQVRSMGHLAGKRWLKGED